jgi:hypothetical protein
MQVKEAVEKAGEYLPEIFDSAQGKELRLEGVEKSEDGRFWKVTFSYSGDSYDAEGRTTLMGRMREYKTVKLRDDSGEFIGAQNGVLLGQL